MSSVEIHNLSSGSYDYNKIWQTYPNSAGGVSVKFDFTNKSSKTIKYIVFRFIPYNRVGDVVGSTIGDRVEYGCRCTGPYEPGHVERLCVLENAWYNSSISYVKLSEVEILYMDGSEETIKGSDVPNTPLASGGCYVATAVYGSYDCPQVWTLRRYRDYDLAESWYGRAFIHTYYAISPTLVKWFGHTEWFKKMWRGTLDRMVNNLQDKGYESTPYEDKNW